MVFAPTPQALTQHVALILSEHLHADDELHVSYTVVQSGWHQHPGREPSLMRAAEPSWTQLFFRVLLPARHATAAGRPTGS